MKVRVFKLDNGSVIYDYPSKVYQGGYFDQSMKELTIFDCPLPDDLQGITFEVLDQNQIPESDSSKGKYHERLYHEAGVLKEDINWEQCLMPDCLVQDKHIVKEQARYDTEMANTMPDAIKLLKIDYELRQAKTDNKLYWAEKALANLDKRVLNGEPDKAIIRLKLEQKIATLKLS